MTKLRGRDAIKDCNAAAHSPVISSERPPANPIIHYSYVTENDEFPQPKHGDRFFLCNLKVQHISNFGE